MKTLIRRFGRISLGPEVPGLRFLRWRPDKKPSECNFDQVGSQKISPLGLLEPQRKKRQ